MELDDEVCLCFHVTKRKLVNFLRIERPRRVGQMSECFGAGTGCGWCRSYMQRLFAAWKQSQDLPEEPSKTDYTHARADYIRQGKGTPAPGATPLPEE